MIDGPGEDDDRDGFIDAACGGLGTDCDDTRADTYPGAPETCDRYDSDCSVTGHIRRAPAAAVNAVDVTEDRDNDGHSALTATCTGGFLRDDCNDNYATDYPGAGDLCDGLDNDCDPLVDEEPGATADCVARTVPNALPASCVRGACTAPVCSAGYVPFCNGCVTPAEVPGSCGTYAKVVCTGVGTYGCDCDPTLCQGCCATGDWCASGGSDTECGVIYGGWCVDCTSTEQTCYGGGCI